MLVQRQQMETRVVAGDAAGAVGFSHVETEALAGDLGALVKLRFGEKSPPRDYVSSVCGTRGLPDALETLLDSSRVKTGPFARRPPHT